MSYYDHYPNLSRRPSFHGSVHGDYHHSSYDDTYGARQPFGEPYQQFPGQAPFPGYNPPLAHQQQFPISPYADSYEDSPLTEPAYFEGVERGRTLSTGYHNGPVMAPPLASYPSKLYRSRSHRASTPGPYTAVPVPMAPMSAMEPYTQRTGASIMFKLKGGYSEGISLSDAMADARLSRSCQYSFHQLHLGLRGRLTMRVRWNGYRSLNYEIPVTGYDGLVNMQSFARRLARGVVHYLQTNGITIPWDRVVLHRLDEETHGLWVPVLTTI